MFKGNPFGGKRILLFAAFLNTTLLCSAQYKKLLDFNGTSGYSPFGSLTLSGNVLYGMTSSGGAYSDGDVFKIDTNGTEYKDMLDFNGTNGKYPYGSLTLSGNVLYGMTENGGTGNDGLVFKIDTNGTGYKDMLDFNATNGKYPYGSLSLSGNVLYGMTYGGGANDSGVVFRIDTNGTRYKNMLDLNGANGSAPYGDLTLSGNVLYGMTWRGGANSEGVVFKLDTNALAAINEVKQQSSNITIYPNPNSGSFSIEMQNINHDAIIQIYSMLGENIYSFKTAINRTEISLGTEPAGIYLYRITDENANLLGEGKFVIAR